MIRRLPAFAVLATIVVLRAAAQEAPPVQPEKFENDPQWHPRLLAIAQGYERWGRIDDSARWAPTLCRAMTQATSNLSAAAVGKAHGQKLYTLFVLDPVAYGGQRSYTVPEAIPELEGCSQVVVKEAWTPKRIDAPATDGQAPAAAREAWSPSGLRPVIKDGAVYHADAKAGLFVMLKLDPKTSGTDQGWVYGTVDADRKTVTGAGRIASCMACHEKAPKDRLFGLPKEPAPAEPKKTGN